ncbi:MAG: GHMP kinase [Acidobacteria bacterium]|nr:MAG: GHMP kinase [Acidobacteriota bacterium]
MRIVKASAFARAGLLGNPSDGYFGKTISVSVKNYRAEVVVYEWPEVEIVLSSQDRCHFDRVEDLVEDVKLNGLYGGLRLIKAAIKRFVEYCQSQRLELGNRTFSMRYDTDIPRQLGLAGSSAIITAVFRALIEFYSVSIRKEILPSLILNVEKQEIGIDAGLQDRVCQVYEGLVHMDFDRQFMEKNGFGRYENLDPALLPPLYIACRTDLSEISGIFHSDLRARWERGERAVVEAMQELAGLVTEGRECLLQRDHRRLGQLMNRNFDIRASICKLDPRNVQMIELARCLGLPATYAGSGGSIVGICEDEATFARLREEFQKLNCHVFRPRVV